MTEYLVVDDSECKTICQVYVTSLLPNKFHTLHAAHNLIHVLDRCWLGLSYTNILLVLDHRAQTIHCAVFFTNFWIHTWMHFTNKLKLPKTTRWSRFQTNITARSLIGRLPRKLRSLLRKQTHTSHALHAKYRCTICINQCVVFGNSRVRTCVQCILLLSTSFVWAPDFSLMSCEGAVV